MISSPLRQIVQGSFKFLKVNHAGQGNQNIKNSCDKLGRDNAARDVCGSATARMGLKEKGKHAACAGHNPAWPPWLPNPYGAKLAQQEA